MGGAVKKLSEVESATVDWAVLISRARKNEEEAQGQLISLTEKSLFRFCYYLSGHRELAQDLTQDTYLKALGRLGDLDKPERFTSWLFVIAKNLFLDHKKSSKNKDHQDLDEIDESTAFDLKNEDKVRDLDVRRALSQLSEEERLILISIDLEGLSYEEVAKSLGITEAAMKSRVYRAREEFLKIFRKA